jgi:2-dehydro-3-deoxyglucarate aldolase/4-hydroxy-2-oxoheptanedioate aldolase
MTPRHLLENATIGSFLAAGSEIVAEAMAGAGFDWLLVDLEHGAGGEDALARQLPAVRAAGIPCLVRVETSERIRIGRALDLGADGVMVPRVESAVIAERVARAARFTPDGDRGVAVSTRAAGYGKTSVSRLSSLEHPIVIVQIESPAAVEEASSIAAVSGIDCLFVGPADLSSSLGIPGDLANPRLTKCMALVVEAATNNSKTAGILARTADDVERFVGMGFRLIALSSDVVILSKAAAEELTVARSRATSR